MEYDFSNIDYIIKNMSIGNEESILLGLKHKGALIRINGIMHAVKFKTHNKDVITAIKELKNDDFWYDGYSVSQFAEAGLHVLGEESYIGKDEKIIELIQSEFNF